MIIIKGINIDSVYNKQAILANKRGKIAPFIIYLQFY